jgi:hypothetical protein
VKQLNDHQRLRDALYIACPSDATPTSRSWKCLRRFPFFFLDKETLSIPAAKQRRWPPVHYILVLPSSLRSWMCFWITGLMFVFTDLNSGRVHACRCVTRTDTSQPRDSGAVACALLPPGGAGGMGGSPRCLSGFGRRWATGHGRIEQPRNGTLRTCTVSLDAGLGRRPWFSTGLMGTRGVHAGRVAQKANPEQHRCRATIQPTQASSGAGTSK